MRLSTVIARGGVSLTLVVPSRVSVVSSCVIVTRILWMRTHFGSQVIVTNSHRLDSYIDSFCVFTTSPHQSTCHQLSSVVLTIKSNLHISLTPAKYIERLVFFQLSSSGSVQTLLS